MSDIDKIIEKHRVKMMKILPGGAHVKENASAVFIMAGAVCEAVEAERGRMNKSDKAMKDSGRWDRARFKCPIHGKHNHAIKASWDMGVELCEMCYWDLLKRECKQMTEVKDETD